MNKLVQGGMTLAQMHRMQRERSKELTEDRKDALAPMANAPGCQILVDVRDDAGRLVGVTAYPTSQAKRDAWQAERNLNTALMGKAVDTAAARAYDLAMAEGRGAAAALQDGLAAAEKARERIAGSPFAVSTETDMVRAEEHKARVREQRKLSGKRLAAGRKATHAKNAQESLVREAARVRAEKAGIPAPKLGFSPTVIVKRKA